jgi:hypothetical protein
MAKTFNDGILPVSFYADESLSAYQYHAVKSASTADYVKRADGASNPGPIGVIQDNDAGDVADAVSIKPFGFTKAVVSGCDVNDNACDVKMGTLLTVGAGTYAGRFYVSGSDALACARAHDAISSGCGIINIFFFGWSVCAHEAS